VFIPTNDIFLILLTPTQHAAVVHTKSGTRLASTMSVIFTNVMLQEEVSKTIGQIGLTLTFSSSS
jgi:hypothetical protein